MWLADTSIWIDHFRQRRADFADRLSEGLILTHSFVIGELACGNLKDRTHVLSHLAELPMIKPAHDIEVMHLIEKRKLWGGGLGWVDSHLLASAMVSHCLFWALDKKLARAADELGIGWH